MILTIKHIDIEGPETLEDFFVEKGFQLKTIELNKGDKFPKITSNIEAVVCLGGPMNVYEENKYKFLKEENVFIKTVLEKQIPFIGICLGSQFLRKGMEVSISNTLSTILTPDS